MSDNTVPVDKKIKSLSLLLEISQCLEQSMDLKLVIKPVLNLISEHTSMIRGAITLLNRNTNEIVIEESLGLSASQKERGKYKKGEGITGRVIETGKPVIIPDITAEPEFLDKTRVRLQNTGRNSIISFICVPVKSGKETIGALSIDVPFENTDILSEDMRLLTIVSSMVAQAMRLRREAQEEKQKLLEENTRLKQVLEDKFRPANIIGNSAEIQDVYALIAQVAKSDTTVLIRGETGTGKELIAHAIHYNSYRSDKAFIKVNCAALPESIIESELFGHEKGSFTGALSTRKGRFELADSGTIFLDEIGELSPLIQVKLLRVLQEKEIERVGSTNTIKVKVRVIAATNRNLEEGIKNSTFREDLYYRLNVFPIHIPPLRDRKSDILLLADFFTEKYSKANHKNISRITTSAIDMLMAYHWPGNVRELENCIERATILSTDSVIHGYHLPPTLQTAEASNTEYRGSLQTALDNLEKDLIIEALKTTRGNMSKAAEWLGITERIMGLRIKKHDIDARKYKTFK